MKKELDIQKSTRSRLIEAAIDTIYEHGYNEATVAKISDSADVSLGTIHHHFEGKEDLLEHAMRELLNVMHQKVMEGTQVANSLRGKLWAVIESVLIDEPREEKTTSVWLSFWVQAEHDQKLRRIRDIYNRRLYSNVHTYLRQILLEIGARNIEEKAKSGTLMLVSMMHGVWINYAIGGDVENDSSDLSYGRLLVWETLEMLLSRSREVLAPEEVAVSTSNNILMDFSFEVISSDLKKLSKWEQYVTPNTRIFFPNFRGKTDIGEKVKIAKSLTDIGVIPVFHIAARNVKDEKELSNTISNLSLAGVKEFLLLGGSEANSVGKFSCVMDLLKSNVFQDHAIDYVGFAGHPEEHPDCRRDVMRQALTEKIAVSKVLGIKSYIVTQFCFTTPPFFSFLDWVKSQKFNVPVRLGLAGRVNSAKLIKYSIACGVGNSLSFLKKNFGRTMDLMNYSPEGLLAEMAARMGARQYDFPISVHFYPFGDTRDTLALVSESGPALTEVDSETIIQP